jgi:hypothetical protein
MAKHIKPAGGHGEKILSAIYNNPDNPDLVTSPEREKWNVNGVIPY